MKRLLASLLLALVLGTAGCSSDGEGGTAGTGGTGGAGGGVDLCGNATAEESAGDPGDGNYDATIVTTTYGIPHVTADDWGSLGYGAGYAYAQQNYCVLMKEIVRANGESLRWFGESGGSLADDLVYRFFKREEGHDGMTEDGLAAMGELFAYFHDKIAERRASGPKDDVLQRLLEFEQDGQKLDDEALASHLSMLIIGGSFLVGRFATDLGLTTLVTVFAVMIALSIVAFLRLASIAAA